MQYKILVDSKLEATVKSASLAADLVDHFYKAGAKGRYPKVELVKGTETLVRYTSMEPKGERTL